MSQKILFAILFIVLSFHSAQAQCCELPYRMSCDKASVRIISQIVLVGYGMSDTVESEEDDLPFDNSTVSGYIMNWVVTLLLWFIYLTIALMILAGTIWSLTAKGFWSWLVCMAFAFFYAMLLGRYWGYTECLIAFAVLFSVLKLFLTTSHGQKISARYLESGDSPILKRMRGNRRK